MSTSRRMRRLGLSTALVLATGLTLAGPASAAPPGRNGAIAFANADNGEIYSVNADGTSLRQLTHVGPAAFANEPDWSPDGRRIAFWSTLTGDPRLYVMARDGSGQRQVFDDQSGFADFAPAFTPDGRSLVFARCAPAPIDTCAIFSVRTNGTGLRGLTRFKTGANEALDSVPAVAADGRIAFSRSGAGGITGQVYVMAADGTGAHPVTAPALTAAFPDWTPDSRHLVVQRNGFRNGAAITRVGADGSDPTSLTRPRFPHNDAQPTPSPDGRLVAFISDRRFPDLCCVELFVVGSDGTGLRRVPTSGITGVISPDWGVVPT